MVQINGFNSGVAPRMSLREYFAGQAMVGLMMLEHDAVMRKELMAFSKEKGISVNALRARMAYNASDAMLKEAANGDY